MIISIDLEKALVKIRDKNSQQTRNRRVLSLFKGHLQPTTNIILNSYGFRGNSIHCREVQIGTHFVESNLAIHIQLVIYLCALR